MHFHMLVIPIWGIAQLGEHQTDDPKVPGSNPGGTQHFFIDSSMIFFFQFHFSQMTDLASKLLLTVSEVALEFWRTLKYDPEFQKLF